MNVNNRKSTLSHFCLTTILAAILGACSGGSGDNPLPVNTSINVSPQGETFEIEENMDENGNCQFDLNRYIDQYITISVRNGQGSPIGRANLSISVDYGSNSFSGFPAMQLYDDLNGNGVVDDPAEYVTGADDPLFRTETAEFTGEKVVILRLNLSCSYAGSLNVFSDGFSGMAEFDITTQAQ